MFKIIPMMLLTVLVASCRDITDIRMNPEPRSAALVATCDGTRTNWDYCYAAAAKLCPYGYEISDRREIPDTEVAADRTHVTRNFYFKCK